MAAISMRGDIKNSADGFVILIKKGKRIRILEQQVSFFFLFNENRA